MYPTTSDPERPTTNPPSGVKKPKPKGSLAPSSKPEDLVDWRQSHAVYVQKASSHPPVSSPTPYTHSASPAEHRFTVKRALPKAAGLILPDPALLPCPVVRAVSGVCMCFWLKKTKANDTTTSC